MRSDFLFRAALAAVVVSLPGAALATSTTCSTSVVCAEFINSFSGGSGGVAIHGEANSGIGVRGTSVTNTGFYGASGSGNYLAPGVEGESTNTNGNGSDDAAGAFGLAGVTSGHYPEYGAVGFGGRFGLSGQTFFAASAGNVGAGVVGLDEGSSSGNAAVAGTSNAGIGGVFVANVSNFNVPTYPVGLLAIATPNNANGAVAVAAESSSFPIYASNTGSSTYVELSTPADLLYGHGTPSGKGVTIDNAGNEILSGTLMTSKGSYVRTTGGSGTTRVAYDAHATAPQIEDVGEGTLVNGRASVAIDPDLADSIDMRRAYDVFLTPDGDCKGLYVAQRTPSGFVVRELQGGRSSLTFSYRLVAKPIDETGERLARAAAIPERPHPLFPAPNGRGAATLQSPEARLEARLGPQGYAKLIAELSRRIAGK